MADCKATLRAQSPFTKFFLYNKHKTAVRWTIHQNSAASKALLGKFWFVSWQLLVYNFVNIT